jgi:arabinofuranosyltransferase
VTSHPRIAAPLSPRARTGVLAALVALAAIVLLRTAWLCDDAAITLRTVDNFIHGYGLRWNVAERVQSYTHPLWLFLLSVPYAITKEGYVSTLVLSMVLSLAAFTCVVFRLARSVPAACAAALALLASRAFVDYAASGLENPLTYLLLALFVLESRRETDPGRRLVRLSLVGGLLAVTRMDALLLIVPALLLEARGRPLVRTVRLAALGFLPFFFWEAFSLVYYGLLVPNTAIAKIHTGIPAGELFAQGLHYLGNSLRQDPATLAVTLVGGAYVLWRGGARERTLVVGAALYLAYVVRIGGDFMSGRFLSAPSLLVVLAATAVRPPFRFAPWAACAGLAGLVFLTPSPSITSGPAFGGKPGNLIDTHGVADERRYYYRNSGLLAPGRIPPYPSYESARVGLLARRLETPVIVEGAIGFTGYFAGPRVHIVDFHALAEPFLARLPAVAPDPLYERFLRGFANRVDPRGWRIGHFLRNIPKGYLATVMTGENQIEDPELARLYDRLALVTRGPIWSPRRLREIVRLNLGIDLPALPSARPAYSGIPWEEILRVRPDLGDVYYRRGMEAIELGDPGAARADFEQAVRLSPAHLFALVELGRFEVAAGELDSARRHLEAARALSPNDLAVHLNLGQLALTENDPAEAEAVYRRILQLDPTLGMGWNNLAVACYAQGRPAEAIDCLERVVRIDPKAAQALEDLGRLYFETGDERRGLAALRRAARLGHAPAQEELRARGAAW